MTEERLLPRNCHPSSLFDMHVTFWSAQHNFTIPIDELDSDHDLVSRFSITPLTGF